MATEAAAISKTESAASPARPYAPGWLTRFLRFLAGLPGPAWPWYAVLGILASLVYHLEFWVVGRTPYGQLDPENTFWGVVLFVGLWAVAYLERVASDAVDATRPALRLDDAEVERLRYELMVAPAVPSAIALAAAASLTAFSYIQDPAGTYILGVPGPIGVAAFVVGSITVGTLFVVLVQLVRQMRRIRATLDDSAIVDPFLPGPLHGFSRLTSRVGIGLILVVTSGLPFTPLPTEPMSFLLRSLPYLVIVPAIALVAFVTPLAGVHGRLVAEKARLQDEAERRLKALLAALNEDIDRGDLARADGLNKQLASMVQQRDLLAKLPTWPWSTGTLRAVITAILLPIALFIVQGVLSRLLFA